MNTREMVERGIECCLAGVMRECQECPFSYTNGGTWECQAALGNRILTLIQQLEAQAPKWISVKEQMPKGEALAVNDYGTMAIGWIEYCTYDQESTYVCRDLDSGIGISHVTHWMPLPEPPKEADK